MIDIEDDETVYIVDMEGATMCAYGTDLAKAVQKFLASVELNISKHKFKELDPMEQKYLKKHNGCVMFEK